MNLESLNHLITSLALVIGSTLAAWWFLFRREGDPGTELSIDVTFAGTQDEKWVIEVAAHLVNKASVRQLYRHFQLTVRYLLPADPIKDCEKKAPGPQLDVPRTIDERIGGSARLFPKSDYIDPKLSFRHSYVTWVPAAATYILVLCKLEFRTRKHWYSLQYTWDEKSAQRLFRVPHQA